MGDNFSAELKKKASKFLKLPLKREPVSSVIPYRYIADCITCLKSFMDGDYSKFLTIFEFAPELAEFLHEAKPYSYFDDCCRFVQYLCNFVLKVHENDHDTDSASPILNSYNPESGCAYYFTEHGNKLRLLPGYSKDSKPKEDCRKKFIEPRSNNWSYLFLFFCPIHGHCYGYHIIDGAEGRKDPFSSIYCYMENAPAEIYYDFAFSLYEYSLNREPAFWRNTRFWHDIFHSYGHLCGDNYKSTRIRNLNHLDTSICEQFNPFVRCFKYMATHLTQSHFTFFLQFFIAIWNK